MPIKIHQKEDFAKMRKAGKLAAQILDYVGAYIEDGVTTDYLNNLCHQKIIENNAIPAPLNYKGFPKSICTSVNHVVCHGIPGGKKLKNGDIINIDVTVIVDGWHGDTSRMYCVGKPAVKAKRLCQVTYDSMMIGIEQVRDGVSLSDIGKAIQGYAESFGYSVVRDFCGHGIGRVFHDEPSVVHYYDKSNESIILKEGMFFTVEPMINAGGHETIISRHDGWTVTTRDKSLSAQYEHTIAVTKDGYEIFTVS